MAENGQDRDTEDLSEEISQQRLEDFRRKGQVSQSKELAALAAMAAASAVAYGMSPQFGGHMAEFMREIFHADIIAKTDLNQSGVLGNYMMKALKLASFIVLPIAAAGFVCGALGSFVQIGSIFSWDPLQPDVNKINPMSGVQRLFSMRHLQETGVILVKATAILAIVYFAIKKEILGSPDSMVSEPITQFTVFGRIAKGIVTPVALVLLGFGIIDFMLNRRDYNKQLRLTKQEAKQEHKEREGDPAIKARVRAMQREISRRRMMKAVKTADVIITNPTHIAIAIVYDKEKMAAPKVVAKGADFMAQKIKKIASDAGIPLVENVPLARTLFKTVKINQGIPRVLFQAVAEVLAHVYRLKNRGV